MGVEAIRDGRDDGGPARLEERRRERRDERLGAVGRDDALRRDAERGRGGVAEVGVGPLGVEGRVSKLGGGRVEHLLRRPEQILVPVQGLEVVEPELLLELVAA